MVVAGSLSDSLSQEQTEAVWQCSAWTIRGHGVYNSKWYSFKKGLHSQAFLHHHLWAGIAKHERLHPKSIAAATFQMPHVLPRLRMKLVRIHGLKNLAPKNFIARWRLVRGLGAGCRRQLKKQFGKKR